MGWQRYWSCATESANEIQRRTGNASGTVQSLFKLQDGGALKLTTSAWLRPNGKTLIRREGKDDWGVQPDPGRAVALTEETYKQLAQQRQIRLSGEDLTPPVDDPQLKKAIAVLRRG